MTPRRETAPNAAREPRSAVRAGFSLTELLVAVSIILLLASILAAAVAGARGSQKRSGTQALISRLNAVIQQQYSTYPSRSVPAAGVLPTGVTASTYRGWYIRRNLISADLPDNWADVALIASGTAQAVVTTSGTIFFPLTAPQRAYQAIWNALPANRKDPAQDTYVGRQFGDAECLFLIIMRSGIGDCLDCGPLRTAQIGDQDTDASGNVIGDGMPEFLDEWGNPIRYVLWPAAFELRPGSGPFFSSSAPLAPGMPAAAPGGTMRPLIFSGGADQRNSILANATGNVAMGPLCGIPEGLSFGGLDTSGSDGRGDNVTNFDGELKQ